MRPLEIWKASVHFAGTAELVGHDTECEGFDGLAFGDTQHLAADPYAGLCLAARATTRLRLAVAVTNPLTRHPSVTANAIATVQAVSCGRAILGLGRGDSSVGFLGRSPAPPALLATYLQDVQGYLSTKGQDTGPSARSIAWLSADSQPKVPVDVAGSGPRVIALGARLAERVTVNVGADPARVAWAVECARNARRQEGLEVLDLSLGAYLVIAAHEEPAVARDLARGPLAAYAHFSGMPGNPKTLLGEHDRTVVRAVAEDYDLGAHGQASGRHVRHLDDGFVDRFAVAGTSAHCARRLRELADVGLDRIVLVEGGDPARHGEQMRAHRNLVEEVIPSLH